MAAKETITFDGITFYKGALAGKSLEDLKAHEAHHGFNDDQFEKLHARLNPTGAELAAEAENKALPAAKKSTKKTR